MSALFISLLISNASAAPVYELPADLYKPGESLESKTTLTVLTANVGNADFFNCGKDYIYKLCLRSTEETVAAHIAALRPDVVTLQETYNEDLCADKPAEKNKKRVCWHWGEREPQYQARRLLGDDYTIVCDNRSYFECLGVRRDVGTIAGCEPGDLCRGTAMIAAPAPDVCDPHAAVFAVDAVVRGVDVRIVDAHPAASNRECRTQQLQGLFERYMGATPVALPDRNMLIMGDLNLDPFSADYTDSAIDVWRAHVGDRKEYYYLNGPAEHDPPYSTNSGRAIDHVVSNFAKGRCITLGRAPGQPRLDGSVGDAFPEGTDHSPILCELDFGKGN